MTKSQIFMSCLMLNCHEGNFGGGSFYKKNRCIIFFSVNMTKSQNFMGGSMFN